MKFVQVEVIIEQEEEGQGFHAWSPNAPGCHSSGDTVEEARTNFKEAMDLLLETAKDLGYPNPVNTHEVIMEKMTVGLPS